MALKYDHVANAPVLRDSLTSGSVTWTVTNWSDSRTSNTTKGNNQDGTERLLYSSQLSPTATATLEVLDSIQAAPEMLREYVYAPGASGSYGGTWVMTSCNLSMQLNAVSTYSVGFEAKSGSVMF